LLQFRKILVFNSSAFYRDKKLSVNVVRFRAASLGPAGPITGVAVVSAVVSRRPERLQQTRRY
jgi:hypothetical protein